MAKPPTLKLPPLSFVRMVWKHKTGVIASWLVLSVLGMAGVFYVPNVYRAESLILVDSQKIPERFVPSTVQVTLEDHLATLKQQILSSTQLEKLIAKFNLYQKQRKKKSPEQVIDLMRGDVQITPEKGWGGANRPATAGSGAFRVAYEGPDPTVVANVVNEISGLFIAENLKARELRAEGTSDFIESQLEEARKQLEQQEASLSRFKKERMGELPQQEAMLVGTLSRLHSELQGNQDAINRAEQNKVMMENTLRMAEAAEATLLRTVQPIATYSTGTPDQRGVPRTQVLREQLEAARIHYTDEHPEVKKLKAELDAATKQESQVTVELNRERERVATVRTQLAVTVKELEARVADRQRILRSIAEYQGKVERVPMREQELAAVTRDYEISKDNYKSLLDKKNSAGMATEMERRQQSERFTLQDPARVPTKPLKPNRMALNMGAVIAGLVLGLAWAVGSELKKGQFLGEWELPASVQVLGRVPMIEIEPYQVGSRSEGI